MQDPVLTDLMRHQSSTAKAERGDASFTRYHDEYLADLDMADVMGRTEETVAKTTAALVYLKSGDHAAARGLLEEAIEAAAADYATLMIESEEAWGLAA